MSMHAEEDRLSEVDWMSRAGDPKDGSVLNEKHALYEHFELS
jgi:hypothetical protein